MHAKQISYLHSELLESIKTQVSLRLEEVIFATLSLKRHSCKNCAFAKSVASSKSGLVKVPQIQNKCINVS